MRSARKTLHRGSVVVVVLWAIGLAALITSAVQLTAFRQSVYGREALARTQARWAARAGLEDTISVLADHTYDPIPNDAFAMILDLESVAFGEVNGAQYEILHHLGGRNFKGPMDEHSKFNINQRENRNLAFEGFRDMRMEIPDSIADWIDEDDDPSLLGVEYDYYQSLANPFDPRNGPMHNLVELELVAGIWPENVRGEDWNLNNRLDPEENDGTYSFPDDEADDILDGGWASRLTTFSLANGATGSGLPRIELRYATIDELMERMGLTEDQAQMLIQYGSAPDASLEQLYTKTLLSLTSEGGKSGSSQRDLSGLQVDMVLMETAITPPHERNPGKININTVSFEFLRDLFPDQEEIADEIVYMRSSRPEGITGISELQDLPEMTDETMNLLASLFTTTSNVFTVTSRGRSIASGLEVEMIVVVDRSTLPVRIIEYREQ